MGIVNIKFAPSYPRRKRFPRLPRRGMRRGTGKTLLARRAPPGAQFIMRPFIPAAKRTGYSGRFNPLSPRRKRFPRITSAGYEAGHRENFVGKARPTGRTIHYAAIHPRRQADGVFWPLPINLHFFLFVVDYMSI